MIEDVIDRAISAGVPLRELREWLFRGLDIVDRKIAKEDGDWNG